MEENVSGTDRVRETNDTPSHEREPRKATPVGPRGTGGETGHPDSDNP